MLRLIFDTAALPECAAANAGNEMRRWTIFIQAAGSFHIGLTLHVSSIMFWRDQTK
jgi:hypothetical protein